MTGRILLKAQSARDAEGVGQDIQRPALIGTCCLRHRRSASCSLIIPMICASVKRLFRMCLLLQRLGRIYITVGDYPGGRSTGTTIVERETAQRWFASSRSRQFRLVCENAGMDPDAVFHRVRPKIAECQAHEDQTFGQYHWYRKRRGLDAPETRSF